MDEGREQNEQSKISSLIPPPINVRSCGDVARWPYVGKVVSSKIALHCRDKEGVSRKAILRYNEVV
jgi:hypothetical protein